jgi:hypothetical protein
MALVGDVQVFALSWKVDALSWLETRVLRIPVFGTRLLGFPLRAPAYGSLRTARLLLITDCRFLFLPNQPSPRSARPSEFPASGGSQYPRRGPARSENSSGVRRKSPPTGNWTTRTPLVGSPSTAALPPFATTSAGCPSIRAKALSRQKTPVQCFSHRVSSRVGGEPKLCNSYGESAYCGSLRQPSIRPNCGHDSSIRIPALTGTGAPNQSSGLACAAQGHPRAAPDASDLWVCRIGS